MLRFEDDVAVPLCIGLINSGLGVNASRTRYACSVASSAGLPCPIWELASPTPTRTQPIPLISPVTRPTADPVARKRAAGVPDPLILRRYPRGGRLVCPHNSRLVPSRDPSRPFTLFPPIIPFAVLLRARPLWNWRAIPRMSDSSGTPRALLCGAILCSRWAWQRGLSGRQGLESSGWLVSALQSSPSNAFAGVPRHAE